MVLQEVEVLVQNALSDTILTTFRKTLKYQSEFSVEGLLRVVVDKKEIYTFNINEKIVKDKDWLPKDTTTAKLSPEARSPTKRKRGRPRKSQTSPENVSDSEDDYEPFSAETEDVKDDEDQKDGLVKQEPLSFDMAGIGQAADQKMVGEQHGAPVFSQEDTALQLQQLALQLAGVSSDLSMQQTEVSVNTMF